MLTWNPPYHNIHPAQSRVVQEAKRFNVVCCGRRFGKTTLGENRLLWILAHGFPVAWFAPSYKYLWEVWDWFADSLRPVAKAINKTEQRIKTSTGGVIDFWSLQDNPDAGRGRKYKRIVIDEAAKARNLRDAWNKSIRPTLSDLIGDADFLSTPKGHDFFWEAFTWGQDRENAEWASWVMPTSQNPYIDPDEIESARKQLPERVYQQEYLATFLDSAGGVFYKVSEAIDRGRTLPAEPTSRSYCLGVDLARVEDFTVLSVMDGTGTQVYHERFNQISWERQVSRIEDVSRRYKANVYIDSTGVGDPIYEALRKRGVAASPYQFTNSSKERLIENLAMKIENGKVKLMDVPEQTNELMAYEYEITPARNVRMNAPEGMHDDCVIALALSVWGATGAGHYSAGLL